MLPPTPAPQCQHLDLIQRAADATPTAIQDMGVDHGGRHIAVAQQFLDGPNVIAGLQEVCGERVPPICPAR